MCLGLLAFATAALCRRFSPRAVALSMLVALTPMTIYLFASINPSGLEIAASISLAAAICCIRHETASGRRRVGAAVNILFVTTSCALVWARPLSWLWAVLLLLLLFPRHRDGTQRPFTALHPIALAVTALNLGFALLWTWHASRLRTLETIYSEQWAEYPIGARILLVFLKFGDILQQSIGVFGWLTAPFPLIAVFLRLFIGAVIVNTAWRGSGTQAVTQDSGVALPYCLLRSRCAVQP